MKALRRGPETCHPGEWGIGPIGCTNVAQYLLGMTKMPSTLRRCIALLLLAMTVVAAIAPGQANEPARLEAVELPTGNADTYIA